MLTAQNGALFATIRARAQHFHFGPLPCASCLRPFRLGNAGQKVNRRRPSKQLKHTDNSSLPPVPAVCDKNRYREHRNSASPCEKCHIAPLWKVTKDPQRDSSYLGQISSIGNAREGNAALRVGFGSHRSRENAAHRGVFHNKFIQIPLRERPGL